MKIQDGIHLFHGDCLEVLKKLPDNSIDLVLADPPYGKMAHGNRWDKIIDFDVLWAELSRITKEKTPIVLFSQQPFASSLINSNFSKFKYEWIWDKHISRGMQTAKFKPMVRHENILVFGEQGHNYFPIMIERDKPIKRKAYPKDDTYFNGKNDGEYRTYTHKNPETILEGFWEKNRGKIHPTQKPISLLEYLIKTYSKEGDIVLDFCYGSNSCGVAAFNTKRKYIGIEKDDKFYEEGKNRLITHLSSSNGDNSSVS
jgi:site-specific DNA-methyltransferase (adenine-specific)